MKEDGIISKANLKEMPEYENAIRALYRHPHFPCMMSLNGQISSNPIYDNIEKSEVEKIIIEYGPDGLKNFRIIPLDLFLIKGFDTNNQPMLLCYWSGKQKSGWKSYLILFRDSNLDNEKDFPDLIKKNHEEDLETFLYRIPKTVTVTKQPNTKYLVSFKIDQGYNDLVAYIFNFCYVNISGDNSDIARREFEFSTGNYSRKFKWYYPEEMEQDEGMMDVNGDIIKYMHNNFGTTLINIPKSIDDPIKLFDYDISLSFAGEDRYIAQKIAESLRSKGFNVFYDDFYKSDLIGKNLSDYFKRVYSKDAQYVVPLISKNYPIKDWTNFELSIARDEAKSRKSEFILPLRLDDTRVFGLLDTVGYIDINKEGISTAVNLLIEKLSKKYLFSWDEIPGNDNRRLIEYLNNNFSIKLAETAKIEKIDDDKTIRLSAENNSISLELNEGKTEVYFKINEVKIDEFIVKNKRGKLNIYSKKLFLR